MQVCLQNCHLAASSLAALATIITDLPHRPALHPDFRLWLTLAPCPAIPPSILSAGPTLVLEPPQGLRARLMHVLTAACADVMAPPAAVKPHAWARVVFSVALFHAAVSERRRFGPRAWGSQCDFTPGDLAATVSSLRHLVEAYSQLGHDRCATESGPDIEHSAAMRSMTDAITSLVGGVHYGGRLTVEGDHALLACMLQKYVVGAVLGCTWDLGAGRNGDLQFAEGGLRLLPGAGAETFQDLVDWAASVPGLEDVECLGLDEHAAAELNQQARTTFAPLNTTWNASLLLLSAFVAAAGLWYPGGTFGSTII